jgi:hypothetical protein
MICSHLTVPASTATVDSMMLDKQGFDFSYSVVVFG